MTNKPPNHPWKEVSGALVTPKAANPKPSTRGGVKTPKKGWAAGPNKVDSFPDPRVPFGPKEKGWGKKRKLEKSF